MPLERDIKKNMLFGVSFSAFHSQLFFCGEIQKFLILHKGVWQSLQVFAGFGYNDSAINHGRNTVMCKLKNHEKLHEKTWRMANFLANKF